MERTSARDLSQTTLLGSRSVDLESAVDASRARRETLAVGRDYPIYPTEVRIGTSSPTVQSLKSSGLRWTLW